MVTTRQSLLNAQECSNVASTSRPVASPARPRASPAKSARNGVLTANNGEKRITNFFPVRKRHNSGDDKTTEKGDVEFLGKRLRRGVTISDIAELPNVSPIQKPVGKENVTTWSSNGCTRVLRSATALGVFDALPVELLHVFIENVPLSRLVSMCMVSREMCSRLEMYVESNASRNRFVLEALAFIEQNDSSKFYTKEDPFYCFGALIKAVSCTRQTESRIQFMHTFFNRAKEMVMCVRGWGRLFCTMCSKWDFLECGKLMMSVIRCENGALEKKIRKLMRVDHGSLPVMEMEVRRALRDLFLDQPCADQRESAFWLSAVLRSQPTISDQGKLLMILYSPTHIRDDGIEEVDWRSLCDTAVTSYQDSKLRVAPLSNAIYRLMQCKALEVPHYSFSQNDIFNIIEEISTFPDPWSFDNFVALLLHRTALIPVSIIARMTHGYQEEAGQMFNCMRTLLFRWGMNACEVLSEPMLRAMKCLPARQRKTLLCALTNAHQHQMNEYINSPHILARNDLAEEFSSHEAVMPLIKQLVSAL